MTEAQRHTPEVEQRGAINIGPVNEWDKTAVLIKSSNHEDFPASHNGQGFIHAWLSHPERMDSVAFLNKVWRPKFIGK